MVIPLTRILALFDIEVSEPILTARRLQRILSATMFVLILSTWKLWTPNGDYPQVPMFRWAGGVPTWIEWSALVTSLISLLLAVEADAVRHWLQRRQARTRPETTVSTMALLVFVLATSLLVAINQQRLQPWCYEFMILAVVLALSLPRHGLSMFRLLVVSIYFYSAMSKLDYSFLHTHGQQLLSATFQSIGLSVERTSGDVSPALVATIPIAELAIGLALCVPRLRRYGLIGSVLMHALLLLALGPWGLDHKPAVLIWNIYFILQNILLFRSRPNHTQASHSVQGPTLSNDSASSETASSLFAHTRTRVASCVILGAVCLPLLEAKGYWDHWLSWAVYASRTERVQVFVRATRRERLPLELQRHIEPPRFDSDWCRVYIDRWSLAELNAPIYPGQRFQLGVALAVARDYELDTDLTVICESAADRMQGTRTSWELFGTAELTEAAQQFRLNGMPRTPRL